MKRSDKSKLWNYKIKILCFARVGKSLVKLKCLSSEALCGPVDKIRTPVLFHKKNWSLNQSFCLYFFQRAKILCWPVGRSLSTNRVRCSFPVEKRYLSAELCTNCLVFATTGIVESLSPVYLAESSKLSIQHKILSLVWRQRTYTEYGIQNKENCLTLCAKPC